MVGLAVGVVPGSQLFVMAECSPSELLASGACFNCLTPWQSEVVRAVLLCQWLQELSPGADCSIDRLMADGSQFANLSMNQLKRVKAQLLCNVRNPSTPTTFNCVEGSCIDPGDGSGTYGSLSECQAACVIPESFNCVDGVCIDPGDGSGTYATLEECEAECEVPINGISFAFWIEMLSQPNPAGADIISNYDFELWDDPGGSRQSRIRLSCAAVGGGSANYTFTVTVSQGVSSNTGTSSPVAMPLRTWHHVAVIYDNTTGFASVYVDTVLVVTSSGTPITLTAQPFGYLNTTNAAHSIVDFLDSYVCLQDMTGVWVGHGLSSSELDDLYNGGAGFNGPPWGSITEPTTWWDFDDAGRINATENFVDSMAGVELDPTGSVVQLEGLIDFAVIKSGFARTLETEVVADFAYAG